MATTKRGLKVNITKALLQTIRRRVNAEDVDGRGAYLDPIKYALSLRTKQRITTVNDNTYRYGAFIATVSMPGWKTYRANMNKWLMAGCPSSMMKDLTQAISFNV